MGHEQIMRSLLQREQAAKTELMELHLQEAKDADRPCYNVHTNIYRDGPHWVCIFGENDSGVVAYGASPAQACDNFDQLWVGGLDQDDEEEEF